MLKHDHGNLSPFTYYPSLIRNASLHYSPHHGHRPDAFHRGHVDVGPGAFGARKLLQWREETGAGNRKQPPRQIWARQALARSIPARALEHCALRFRHVAEV